MTASPSPLTSLLLPSVSPQQASWINLKLSLPSDSGLNVGLVLVRRLSELFAVQFAFKLSRLRLLARPVTSDRQHFDSGQPSSQHVANSSCSIDYLQCIGA